MAHIAFPACAATRTWSGASALSSLWTDAANWAGAVAPSAGDSLFFPPSASRVNNTNNYPAGTVFGSITFTGSGYALSGTNTLALTNGISAQNTLQTNQIVFPVQLNAAQTFLAASSANALLFDGFIYLNGFDLTFNTIGTIRVQIGIAQTGNVIKTGAGTLWLQALLGDSYSGTTFVNAGVVELDSAFFGPNISIPGDLVVGDGTNSATAQDVLSSQIAATSHVKINWSSTLALNDNSESMASLTMSSGTLSTGTGTNTLLGDVTATSSNGTQPVITGNLSLGGATRNFNITSGTGILDLAIAAVIMDGGAGAGLTKTGNGSLGLFGANTFSGITTVQTGALFVENPLALGASGSSANGTVVDSGAELDVSGVSVANESLTLNNGANFGVTANGSGSWGGPIVLNGTANVQAESGYSLTNTGVISGPGGMTINGGTICLFGSAGNTYAGTTLVASGTVIMNKTAGASIPSGPLIIGDGVGGPGADVVREAQSSDIGATVPITINSSGLLDLSGHSDACGSLTFNGGTVSTGAGILTPAGNILVNGNPNAQASFQGSLFLTFTPTVDVETVADALVPEMLLLANIIGNFGLTKTGPGTLSLGGSNSFTGPVQVNAGTLAVANPFALGTTNSGTTVNSNAVLQVNTSVPGEPLTLNGGSIFSVAANGTGGNWDGPTILNGTANVTVAGGQSLTNGGIVSGPGGMTINGGTLYLFGGLGNTYAGTTFVASGTVIMNKAAGAAIPSGPLIIGDGVGGPNADVVREAQSSDIGSTVPITINSSGLLDLNGFTDLCGSLTLNGGAVSTATGILTPGGNILVNGNPVAQASFQGNLALTSTSTIDVETTANALVPEMLLSAKVFGNLGLTKMGSGTLSLAGSNSLSGPVQVNAGTLAVGNSFALGTSSGATVNSNAVLQLTGVSVANVPLSLNGNTNNGAVGPATFSASGGSNSWSGPIILATNTSIFVQNSNDVLNLGGAISGSGELDQWGNGTLMFTGATANTYTNLTQTITGTLLLAKTFANSSIIGPLYVNVGAPPGTKAASRMTNAFQFGPTAALKVGGGGLFDFNGLSGNMGSINGAGNINLENAALGVGNDNADSEFGGGITGTFGFTKYGAGTMRMDPGSVVQVSEIVVWNGTLQMDASAAGTAVYTKVNSILSGSGTVGSLIIDNGGTLEPGDPGAAGTLSVTGNLSANAAGAYAFTLKGPAAKSDFGNMSVHGTTQINGNLAVALEFVPAAGQPIDLIQNSSPVSGTFSGLPEGAITNLNGLPFQISYVGGAGGHDVTLTWAPVQPQFQAITLNNGTLALIWTTQAGASYQLQYNSDLNSSNWINLGPPAIASGTTLSFTDSVNAIPQRFYRVVLLP